jgi:hypothetical protein
MYFFYKKLVKKIKIYKKLKFIKNLIFFFIFFIKVNFIKMNNFLKILILFLFLFLFFKNFKKTEKFYNYQNNIYIIQNFYSSKNFISINNYCNNLIPKYDNRLNTRKSICLDYKNNKYLYNLIYNNKQIKDIIKNINTRKFKLIPSYPIEYRVYDNNSNGMDWHIDTSLFNPDCLELVLTLSNISDSKFLWKEDNNIKNIYTKSNTLVIVKPNTVLHKVSKLNYGTRRILKFIIEFDNCEPNHNYYMEINNCPF